MRGSSVGGGLDRLLASGRLRETPLRHVEPWFARLEARWTSRLLRLDGGQASAPFVIAVTGAWRGGSWKTPLAVAVAQALATRGHRGCWVGRGYRAERARDGFLADARAALSAGDEAFASRRTLSRVGVDVGVARSWDRALAMIAERTGDHFAVLDGCRQRVPPERGCSLVAVDGVSRGDTPFPRHAGLPTGLGMALSPLDRWLVPVVDVRERPVPEALGATYDLAFDRPLEPPDASDAVLVTTHARPERFVTALRRRGLAPRTHLALPDHANASDVRRALAGLPRGGHGYSSVLAADKGALALAGLVLPAPLVLVSCAVQPAPALVDALADAVGKFSR